MTAREALRAGAAAIGGATPRLDAELLLAHLLGVSREALLLGGLDRGVEPTAWHAVVARRRAGEPVAYITGVREFWSLPIRVTPGVLIPRPDSETLIEAALRARPRDAVRRVLDLGTGSGALLLAALSEWSEAWGLGVDRSMAAVAVARGNALALGMGRRTAFAVCDWSAALGARFDLILCNPPYVADGAAHPSTAAEPAAALFAGARGLDAYRRILPELPRLLTPGGAAVLELGVGQADVVQVMANAAGLQTTVDFDVEKRARALLLENAAQE